MADSVALIPDTPEDLHWHHDGTKDVSEWVHLGTKTVQGEEIEFRARIHRYGEPGDYRLEPFVQFRGTSVEEWAMGFEGRDLEQILPIAGAIVASAPNGLHP